ncbi:YigZ family protein [Alteromonas ponticola]|uniref:YigZ family protein n=1 Tax=Alteromonas aquimaris TaxID=2998417 RepID=A0ABT3P9T9_9ALTE|nr:YigZ family protein [Alteromonas aquimaris]MCW8109540.1 YigZ family protein [Alteromonas aquimaris]
MSFPVPANSVHTQFEVKKSRFITLAGFASSRQEAMDLLEQAKITYPDARHHCWAYIIGHPASPELAAMADDGEPSGTAGRPILNVLQHKQVGHIMMVVVRYFGGIKLGAGGLVRAYSAAAQAGMNELSLKHDVPVWNVVVVVDFAQEQYIRHWLEQHAGVVNNVAYSNEVTLTVTIPTAARDALAAILGPIGGTILQSQSGQMT